MNKTKLLLVLLVSAAIKYLLLPLLDWQSMLRSDIEASNSMLQKSLSLKERMPKYREQEQYLESLNNEHLQRLFVKSQNTQLSIQQAIQKSLDDAKLTQDRFEWLLDVPGDIHQYMATVSVKGELQDLIEWHLGLMEQPRWMFINEWSIRRLNNRDDDIAAFQGDLTITVFATEQSAIKKEEVDESVQ